MQSSSHFVRISESHPFTAKNFLFSVDDYQDKLFTSSVSRSAEFEGKSKSSKLGSILASPRPSNFISSNFEFAHESAFESSNSTRAMSPFKTILPIFSTFKAPSTCYLVTPLGKGPTLIALLIKKIIKISIKHPKNIILLLFIFILVYAVKKTQTLTSKLEVKIRKVLVVDEYNIKPVTLVFMGDQKKNKPKYGNKRFAFGLIKLEVKMKTKHE